MVKLLKNKSATQIRAEILAFIEIDVATKFIQYKRQININEYYKLNLTEMRKQISFLVCPLLIIGSFIFFANSCKMDDDNNNGGNNTGIPVLTTIAVANVTSNTAISGGNITSEGDATVEVRGVCWSTNSTPNIEDSKTEDGTGEGVFISSLTGLIPETTYYVCAYATNSKGTGYGNPLSFTTLAATVFLPVLTTKEVTEITMTTAISGGNISSNGGATITVRGVCWSTNPIPTINDSKTEDGAGEGSFVSNIRGLRANTTYYVRAYATNSKGTGYGSTISFKTKQGFTDTRDGNIYQTVTIGDQVWMAENLRYLPSVVESDTGSDTIAFYYVYGYEGTNVNAAKATEEYTTYGVLYNWSAACISCPQGWHLPSDEEWTQLIDYLGGENVAGGKLKETGTTHWYSPNIGATNETGFTALPGGYCRSRFGSFFHIGSNGFWWSSTDASYSTVQCLIMFHSNSRVERSFSNKSSGLSVRCIKD